MSQADTLPRPEEVLDDSRVQYQAMTDLSDEEYQQLAEDIRERGVLQPIITDESGTILDGHHRAALAEHFDLDESREPAYVVVGDLEDDSEKFARAIKQNVLGRDTTDAVKSHAVKQYIETTWDRTDDGDLIRPETDTEIAKKLGVSEVTVGRVFDGSAVGATVNVVKKSRAKIIYHDRVKAREYYEDNPDASYREVARQVETSRPKVAEWLKKDFDEGDDEDNSDNDTSLTAFARNESEGEKAQETFTKKDDDDSDEEVREFAEQKAEEIAQNKTTPDSAARKVSTRERVVEGERDPIRTTDDGDTEETQTQDDDTDEGPLKVLNLYAGIGGNRQLWDDVEVTAVEWDEDTAKIYRDHFPDDDVVVADAHEYLREHIFDGWDYIWSSPPCPTHSRTNHFTQVQHESAQYPDMQLYEEILLLDHLHEQLGYDYTVENVVSYYDPLIEPQEVADHYFWTTVSIPEFETESRNILSAADGRDSHFDFEREQRRLGFELDEYDIPKSRKEKTLRNCVNPDLGRHILNQVGVNDDETHNQVRATNRGDSDE